MPNPRNEPADVETDIENIILKFARARGWAEGWKNLPAQKRDEIIDAIRSDLFPEPKTP